ncbi:MAG: hypothetical protein ABI321_14400 [Polyangia bacterium]
MTIKGAFVVASVAGLFASMAPLTASADKTGAEVKCDGVNACKGKSGCKSAKNDCAGKNGCKGQGFMKTTAKDCKAKGGTVDTAMAK